MKDPIFVVNSFLCFWDHKQNLWEVLSKEVVKSLEISFEKFSSASVEAIRTQDHDDLLPTGGVEYFFEDQAIENICLEPLGVVQTSSVNDKVSWSSSDRTWEFGLAGIMAYLQVVLPGSFDEEGVFLKGLWDDFQTFVG